MLVIYNSLSRKKEPFEPLNAGKVAMYVCGVTVYDHCHLGHARSMVAFDIIVRYLRHQGFEVTFVRNITDIDDKIIMRAAELGVDIGTLTNDYIASMHQDMKALNLLAPSVEPRATEHIGSIIALIQDLLDKGFAYQSANGDICFEVSRFKEYGKLSHKDLDGLLAGARVEVVVEKRSPLDFVLWKMAKPNEPSYTSPWGEGRPGWHIECSAMAMHELGQQFDIHGGGLDLQFPHHENEIAQSEASTGTCFAKYWMHTGMLQVNQEKMSKSLGNFFTIQEVLEQHQPEVVRYFLLSSHYRSPLNYSKDTILNAEQAINRLYQTLKEVPAKEGDIDTGWVEQFYAAMNDDFNTPVALSVLFQLSHEINKTKSTKLSFTLKHLANVLGLLQEAPEAFFQAGVKLDAETIANLIAQRNQAREQRNWQKADEIRDNLLAEGIELEDTATGTLWKRRS